MILGKVRVIIWIWLLYKNTLIYTSMITKFKIFESNFNKPDPKEIFDNITINENKIPFRKFSKAKSQNSDWIFIPNTFECALFNSTLFRFYYKYMKNNNIFSRIVPIPEWIDNEPFDIIIGYLKRFSEYLNSHQFSMDTDQERRISDSKILSDLDKIANHLIFETYFNDSIPNEMKIINYIKYNWKNIDKIPETEKEHHIRTIFRNIKENNQIYNALNGIYLEPIITLKNYAG